MRHKQSVTSKVTMIENKLNVLLYHIKTSNRREAIEVIEKLKEKLQDIQTLVNSEN